MNKKFSQYLLTWWDIHGRKDLPWQINQTAYRVWISEIMLQQTQVKTVIPYYQKFMTSFPNLESLAAASIDDVLHHWTGLGYYARARNIHKTAIIVAEQFAGQFPQDQESLEMLPGIGRSTAGAIASFAYNKHRAILDGNVKRVLTRVQGIKQWPGDAATLKELWHNSEGLTPAQRTADYNQAIMDLGATVCTRSKPNCSECPLSSDCFAFNNNLVAEIPGKKAKKTNPVRDAVLLIMIDTEAQLYLEKRPETGIWGSLYCFPQFETQEQASEYLALNNIEGSTNKLKKITHKFSHFTLNITPTCIQTNTRCNIIAERESHWIQPKQALAQLGLPTPVKALIQQIGNLDD